MKVKERKKRDKKRVEVGEKKKTYEDILNYLRNFSRSFCNYMYHFGSVSQPSIKDLLFVLFLVWEWLFAGSVEK